MMVTTMVRSRRAARLRLEPSTTTRALLLTLACVTALGAIAAGKGGTPDLRFRVLDETAPPGGTVQMKVMTTEVTPISGGRPGFR